MNQCECVHEPPPCPSSEDGELILVLPGHVSMTTPSPLESSDHFLLLPHFSKSGPIGKANQGRRGVPENPHFLTSMKHLYLSSQDLVREMFSLYTENILGLCVNVFMVL